MAIYGHKRGQTPSNIETHGVCLLFVCLFFNFDLETVRPSITKSVLRARDKKDDVEGRFEDLEVPTMIDIMVF